MWTLLYVHDGDGAQRLLALNDEIALLTAQIETLFTSHRWGPLLTSIPGIGTLLGARILVETGGNLTARFGTEARLAAYAGLAPVPRFWIGARQSTATAQGTTDT